MPAAVRLRGQTTDKTARERSVAAAAFRLIARDGDTGLTELRVAAEAGNLPNLPRDPFPTQDVVHKGDCCTSW